MTGNLYGYRRRVNIVYVVNIVEVLCMGKGKGEGFS